MPEGKTPALASISHHCFFVWLITKMTIQGYSK
jgi:hypothetical protein